MCSDLKDHPLQSKAERGAEWVGVICWWGPAKHKHVIMSEKMLTWIKFAVKFRLGCYIWKPTTIIIKKKNMLASDLRPLWVAFKRAMWQRGLYCLCIYKSVRMYLWSTTGFSIGWPSSSWIWSHWERNKKLAEIKRFVYPLPTLTLIHCAAKESLILDICWRTDAVSCCHHFLKSN